MRHKQNIVLLNRLKIFKIFMKCNNNEEKNWKVNNTPGYISSLFNNN